MAKKSAGLLVYRVRPGNGIEVFLVHPGGPIWAKKDEGVWSIPKGEFDESEDALVAARREFVEEVGQDPPTGSARPLAPVRLKSGKTVYAWAMEGDVDPAALRSNLFTMDWPPYSGKRAQFPEVDRAAWFSLGEARRRINAGQAPLLTELEALLRA